MGLFDNIFLDKDTPTALLDNPEIKSPDGKKEEAKAPYDPKNDPIAPAMEDKKDESGIQETNPAEVSFDIGGDLDFSNIGEGAGEDTKTTEIGEVNTEAQGQNDSFSVNVGSETTTTDTANEGEGVSSIAMIQGGTASVVDSIDIGGTEQSTETGTSPEIQIEIHDIEEHQVGDASLIGNGGGGIYGFMEKSIPSEADALAAQTIADSEVKVEENKTVEEILPESFTSLDTFGSTTETMDETHIESIVSDESSPLIEIVSSTPGRGGKIQELIAKLIAELKTIDAEEEKIESERRQKIQNITQREQELEHEYTTRKEALKYERASLELPIDKSAEKERINTLIASFQEDIG